MRLLPCLALALALALATGLQPQERPFKESHSLNWGKVSHLPLGACARCRAMMSQGATGSSGRCAHGRGGHGLQPCQGAAAWALSLLPPCWEPRSCKVLGREPGKRQGEGPESCGAG